MTSQKSLVLMVLWVIVLCAGYLATPVESPKLKQSQLELKIVSYEDNSPYWENASLYYL